MEYKRGDRVCRIIEGMFFKKGQPAVVISRCPNYIDDYIVLTRFGKRYKKVNWSKSAFVSYEVYKSQLYKVMGEE
jgi:hypothetical protein